MHGRVKIRSIRGSDIHNCIWTGTHELFLFFVCFVFRSFVPSFPFHWKRGGRGIFSIQDYVIFTLYEFSRIYLFVCSVTSYLNQVFRLFSAWTTWKHTPRSTLRPPLVRDSWRRGPLHLLKVCRPLRPLGLCPWRSLLRRSCLGRFRRSRPRFRLPLPSFRTRLSLWRIFLLLLLQLSHMNSFWLVCHGR